MVETLRRGAQAISARISPAQTNATAINAQQDFGIGDTGDGYSRRSFYELMELYALNNNMVDAMLARDWARGEKLRGVRGLRTPGNALVEFYAATVAPGTLPDALPIQSDDSESLDELIEAVHAIWEASNFSSGKQVLVRTVIRLGDVFIKAVQRASDGHPYMQVIHPWYVSDFETDERGFLTYIRLDMPQDTQDDDGRVLIETEIWDKEDNRYALYRHYEDLEADEDKLGTPEIEHLDYADYFGFDFIPFMHIKSRDVGDKFGQPPIQPALDKIDEVNTLATEINDDLARHNRAKYVISSNMLDGEGRPVFPPELYSPDGDMEIQTQAINGEEYYFLPGMAGLAAIGAGIDWNAKLQARDDEYDHLASTDLPELYWYQLADDDNVSGVALRRKMAPAVSNVIEVRGNIESGVIRAQMQCLTLGQLAGIETFTRLPTWEDGGLRHYFEERDVIPLSDEERADTDIKRQQANQLMLLNGYTERWVMIEIDHVPEDDVDEMLGADAREQGPTVAADLLALRATRETGEETEDQPPVSGQVPE